MIEMTPIEKTAVGQELILIGRSLGNKEGNKEGRNAEGRTDRGDPSGPASPGTPPAFQKGAFGDEPEQTEGPL